MRQKPLDTLFLFLFPSVLIPPSLPSFLFSCDQHCSLRVFLSLWEGTFSCRNILLKEHSPEGYLPKHTGWHSMSSVGMEMNEGGEHICKNSV